MRAINITMQGQGNPLVLFHGWGFDSQIWSPLLSALTNHHQLYLVDLPGFGLTPQMEWEEFKPALINQLPANFSLAGWSMGGLFASRLAIEEPHRVSHLVNIASSPYFIREENWPGVDRHILQSFYHDVANNPQQTLQAFIKLQLQDQPLHMMEHMPTVNALRSGLDVLVNWDLRQALTHVNKPVFYMFGRLDAITPRKTMTTMQERYPYFNYLQFAKAAHVPFLSHPEQFIVALNEFLL